MLNTQAIMKNFHIIQYIGNKDAYNCNFSYSKINKKHMFSLAEITRTSKEKRRVSYKPICTTLGKVFALLV